MNTPAGTNAGGDGAGTDARTAPPPPLVDEPTGSHPDAPDPALPVNAARSTGWPQALAWMATFVFVVTLPLWVGSGVSNFLVDLLILAAVAQWWGFLAGHCGVVSLTGGLLAGSGAYLWSILVAEGGVNPVLAVALAGVGSLAVAAISGLVLLRLPAGWSALGGLVFTVVLRDALEQVDSTAATVGRNVPSVVELDATLRQGLTTWLAVVVGVGSVAAVSAVRRSRVGLMVVAHRDDPEAAATLGIRARRLQLALWTAGGAAVAMAGAIVHLRAGSVQLAVAFDPLQWVVPALVAASLGGMRTIAGPVVGALIYVVMERVFGVAVALLLCGLGAASLMVWLPGGLAAVAVPAGQRVWRAHVASRSGLLAQLMSASRR